MKVILSIKLNTNSLESVKQISSLTVEAPPRGSAL